ncbi:kinase-like domain-containing protein [Abortiporus biennis]|nr:kinase-like domain-containing protein [Abortiporus biennis]
MIRRASDHPTIPHIRPPLSKGVLMAWLKATVASQRVQMKVLNLLHGVSMPDLNADEKLDELKLLITTSERPIFGPIPPPPERPASRQLLQISFPSSNSTSEGSISGEDASMPVAQLTEMVSEDYSMTSESSSGDGARFFFNPVTPIAFTFQVAVTTTVEDSAISTIESSSSATEIIRPTKPSLADFALVRRLGAGHFGTVFLARHNCSGRFIALKLMSKCPDTDDSEVVDDEYLQERMEARCGQALEEYFAFRRLEGVPGVAELQVSWHDTRFFYYGMTYYPGGDLASQLEMHGRFEHDKAVFYIAQLILYIENLHARGVIHRDIKPANILIDDKGYLVIGDLGLAKSFSRHACLFEKEVDVTGVRTTQDNGKHNFGDVTASPCGTPQFMAPEIYNCELYSYGYDVWSVGIVAFLMFLGRYPWSNSTLPGSIANLILKEPIKVEQWEREMYSLSEDAEIFLLKILNKDQDARPSATRLKADPLFKDIDWEKLARREYPAPWVPPIVNNTSSSVPPPTAESGHAFTDEEDPIPFFSYVSPSLSNSSPQLEINTTTTVVTSTAVTPSETYNSIDFAPSIPNSVSAGNLIWPSLGISLGANPQPSGSFCSTVYFLQASPTAISSIGDINYSESLPTVFDNVTPLPLPTSLPGAPPSLCSLGPADCTLELLGDIPSASIHHFDLGLTRPDFAINKVLLASHSLDKVESITNPTAAFAGRSNELTSISLEDPFDSPETTALMLSPILPCVPPPSPVTLATCLLDSFAPKKIIYATGHDGSLRFLARFRTWMKRLWNIVSSWRRVL